MIEKYLYTIIISICFIPTIAFAFTSRTLTEDEINMLKERPAVNQYQIQNAAIGNENSITSQVANNGDVKTQVDNSTINNLSWGGGGFIVGIITSIIANFIYDKFKK